MHAFPLDGCIFTGLNSRLSSTPASTVPPLGGKTVRLPLEMCPVLATTHPACGGSPRHLDSLLPQAMCLPFFPCGGAADKGLVSTESEACLTNLFGDTSVADVPSGGRDPSDLRVGIPLKEVHVLDGVPNLVLDHRVAWDFRGGDCNDGSGGPEVLGNRVAGAPLSNKWP